MSPYPQVAVPVSRRLAAKARLKSVAHRAEGGDPTVEGPLIAIGWDSPTTDLGRHGLAYLVLAQDRGTPMWVSDDELVEIVDDAEEVERADH
jgi:hypothetical protein